MLGQELSEFLRRRERIGKKWYKTPDSQSDIQHGYHLIRRFREQARSHRFWRCPHILWMTTVPVGASLLAKAEYQAVQMLKDPPPSQAVEGLQVSVVSTKTECPANHCGSLPASEGAVGVTAGNPSLNTVIAPGKLFTSATP